MCERVFVYVIMFSCQSVHCSSVGVFLCECSLSSFMNTKGVTFNQANPDFFFHDLSILKILVFLVKYHSLTVLHNRMDSVFFFFYFFLTLFVHS